MPDSVSVEPEALIVRFLTQVVAPPVTAGAVGAARSIRAVLPALAVAGVQAEVLPALSTSGTAPWSVPSAVTNGVPRCRRQVVPPLVEVRYW